MIYSNFFLSTYFSSIDRNESFITLSFPKFNQTITECKQSEVSSNTNIFAGMVFGTTLTNDDVTGYCGLSAVDLNS